MSEGRRLVLENARCFTRAEVAPVERRQVTPKVASSRLFPLHEATLRRWT